MPDLRISQLRLKASRPPRSRLRIWLTGSLAAHLFALLLAVLVRVAVPPPQPEQPAFGMVFAPPAKTAKGSPNPTKYTSTPQGEPDRDMHPTQQSQVSPRITPPTPEQQPQPPQPRPPEVNLLPPEYQQAPEPPPPEREQAEQVPQAERRPRTAQARPRPSRQRSNPFANPMQFSLAPQAHSGASGGMRNSRSLDLSAGPMIAGGRLQDAVPHVIGPGGTQDYMELLSEFVELHKYYPPSAATNGEQGTAVVRITVERDGTVRGMRLVSSSGSTMLDAAWEAVFRDNKLPPFPEDMNVPQQTFTLSLNYELLYH